MLSRLLRPAQSSNRPQCRYGSRSIRLGAATQQPDRTAAVSPDWPLEPPALSGRPVGTPPSAAGKPVSEATEAAAAFPAASAPHWPATAASAAEPASGAREAPAIAGDTQT